MDPLQPPTTEPPKRNTNWHNAIASYMSRHVRHVRASSSEWYRIHRGSGGSSGGGNGWGFVLLVAGVIFAGWLAYKVFLWTCEFVRAVIQGICHCVIAAVPFILLGGIGLLVVAWFHRSHRS